MAEILLQIGKLLVDRPLDAGRSLAVVAQKSLGVSQTHQEVLLAFSWLPELGALLVERPDGIRR